MNNLHKHVENHWSEFDWWTRDKQRMISGVWCNPRKKNSKIFLLSRCFEIAFISQKPPWVFSLELALRWMHALLVQNSNSIVPNTCSNRETKNEWIMIVDGYKYMLVIGVTGWELTIYSILDSFGCRWPFLGSFVISLCRREMRVLLVRWLVSVQWVLVLGQWSREREQLVWMPFSLGPSLNCSRATCRLLCKIRHRFSLWWLENDETIASMAPIWMLMPSVFHGIYPSPWAKWFSPKNGKTFRTCVWNFPTGSRIITVKSVKSTANDCGSCSVAGRSFKNDTIWNFPFLSWIIFVFKSLIRFKLRLYCKYWDNLWGRWN